MGGECSSRFLPNRLEEEEEEQKEEEEKEGEAQKEADSGGKAQ